MGEQPQPLAWSKLPPHTRQIQFVLNGRPLACGRDDFNRYGAGGTPVAVGILRFEKDGVEAGLQAGCVERPNQRFDVGIVGAVKRLQGFEGGCQPRGRADGKAGGADRLGRFGVGAAAGAAGVVGGCGECDSHSLRHARRKCARVRDVGAGWQLVGTSGGLGGIDEGFQNLVDD